MKKKIVVRVAVALFSVALSILLFIYSKNQSMQMLDEIIEKSDCCVVLNYLGGTPISFNADVDNIKIENLKHLEIESNVETSVEELIGITYWDEYYFPDFEVILAKQYDNGKPIIEYADEYVDQRGIYILFLTKSDDGDYYYITDGKSGAIELKNGIIDLKPLDKRLVLAMWFKYDNDIRSFLKWYEDEYRFSDEMVPVKPIPPELFNKRLNYY